MKSQNLFLSVTLLFSLAVFSQPLFAQDSTAVVKGAKMLFAETSYDFGTALQNSEVKHVFKFKNIGSDTLRISDVKTSCGCTAAESSKIIPPQKEGQIVVSYHTGRNLGKVSKTVYIYSNDVEAPQRSVSLHGMVIQKTEGSEKSSQ